MSPPTDFDMLNHRDERAVEWAGSHAGETITSDGNGGLVNETTRAMIRDLVVNGLQDDNSRAFIAEALHKAYGFSLKHAKQVANDEVRNAEQHGLLTGYKSVGMDEKQWLKSNAEGVCALCEANAAEGYIPITNEFSSGHQAPLAHSGCRCDLVARIRPK